MRREPFDSFSFAMLSPGVGALPLLLLPIRGPRRQPMPGSGRRLIAAFGRGYGERRVNSILQPRSNTLFDC
jgi:hypothetical protein